MHLAQASLKDEDDDDDDDGEPLEGTETGACKRSSGATVFRGMPCRSFRMADSSNGSSTRAPDPAFPARAVLPKRWMYCSRVVRPTCSTNVTSG